MHLRGLVGKEAYQGLFWAFFWMSTPVLGQEASGGDEDRESAELDAVDDAGSDQPNAATPAESSSVGLSPPPVKEPPESEPAIDLKLSTNRERVFGSYRVRVSVARPNFNDGIKGYEKFYGSPHWYPQVGADWFAWDWYATLGLSFRMGYYTADGHAAKKKAGVSSTTPNKDLSVDDIEQDPSSSTSLTLVPFQACIAAEFTPFTRKWLVLDGWFGLERMYIQEVRNATTKAKAAAVDGQGTGSSDDALTNHTWKNSTVVGVAANISLNGLDERSTQSMRGSMGLSSIYLSPFMEIVRSPDKSGISFGRTVLGLAFTFESAN